MQREEHPEENAGDSPAQNVHQQAANAGREEAENGGGGGRPVAQNVLASLMRLQSLLGQTPLQMPRGIPNLVRQYSETEDGGGRSPTNPNGTPQVRRQRMVDMERGRDGRRDEGEDEMEDADDDDFCAELGRMLGRMLQTNKFLCIVGVANLVCTLLVIITAFVYFLVNNVTLVSFLSYILCITSTFDARSFKKVVTGQSTRFWLAFFAMRIVFRQCLIQLAFGQHIYTLPTLLFHQTATANGENAARSYSSTFYILAISTYFILDCALSLKILVFIMPKCMNAVKGRLYQWIEYSSFLYTFAIPFIHWNAYMAAFWFTLVYGGAKLLIGLALLAYWLVTTFNLVLFFFRGKPKLGSTPTEAECKRQEQCTICCQEAFKKPVKLECSHIFCFECIEKWLEKKKTCPFCRTAVVEKLEDTNYRDGDCMMELGMILA